MQMMVQRERGFRWQALLQRLRVPMGFAAGILFIVVARPTWKTMLAGVPLALSGAALRAWASGHLHKNVELAQSGPYAFTRNPLYLGSLVLLCGCAVCGDVLWLGVLLLALFLAIYVPVMRAEAAHLRAVFGRDYEGWAAHVPLLLPRLVPHGKVLSRSFDPGQYLRHREYRAALGVAAVIGALAVKAAGIL
jgi:protein-S-isoprenylcysteine O-methyltransferase Ste14